MRVSWMMLGWIQFKQGNQRWQTSPAAPPGGLGHCQTGMCMSNFMMIGWEMAEILHIEISWKHVSVTYDLDLWPKILKIFVSHRVPILNVYVKFHDDRLRNDWDITLWNFCENTDKHTNKQTDMGITIPRPPPMGGEVTNMNHTVGLHTLRTCAAMTHHNYKSTFWNPFVYAHACLGINNYCLN